MIEINHVQSYRDGGTLEIKYNGNNVFCIDNRIISKAQDGTSHGIVHFVVFPCYPSKGNHVDGKENLEFAKLVLDKAMVGRKYPTQVAMIQKGIDWINKQLGTLCTAADQIELKPCPHCGGEAKFMSIVPPTIRCWGCSAEFVVGISSLGTMTAEVWNTRVKEET